MAKQKAYTQSTDNTADIFFSQSKPNQIEEPTQDTKHTNITKQSKVTNKSKHYDQRGSRSERFGLLLDSQLKEDLRLLSNATGSKSVNDFIVTILLNYVEQDDNQIKLEQYKQLIEK